MKDEEYTRGLEEGRIEERRRLVSAAKVFALGVACAMALTAAGYLLGIAEEIAIAAGAIIVGARISL
ncbi:hypothetical protein [Rhodopseudomonas palustris]|uniref:hypothetical protein n=1 Tax=Rhodopseudomonas palustris TaxID=1076 RepID=UPI000D1AB06B|nr:hypothetical protein [Rhodopseudomonas palustris]